MRKNHKIKAALFAGLAGTMLFGSCMTAYAAGVTKANGKLYYYQADGSLANGLIHDTASDKYYYALSDGSLVTGWLHLDQDYYYMSDGGSLWLLLLSGIRQMRTERGYANRRQLVLIRNRRQDADRFPECQRKHLLL